MSDYHAAASPQISPDLTVNVVASTYTQCGCIYYQEEYNFFQQQIEQIGDTKINAEYKIR